MRNEDDKLREDWLLLTGIGVQPNVLSIEEQARQLESVTAKSVASQVAEEGFDWLIACDYYAPEECCQIVDRVAVHNGASVIWIKGAAVQTWGEIIAGWMMSDDWDESLVTTVGCPAGGAVNKKYLAAMKQQLGNYRNMYVSYKGGVIRDEHGKYGYTKIKHNLFAARREYAEFGMTLNTCYAYESESDIEGQILIQRSVDSKAAWLISSKGRVPDGMEIDLSQFGL